MNTWTVVWIYEKFFDNKLPDRCDFFSSLKDDCINEKDCLHAVDVWIIFQMKTVGDCHDPYLKTFVLLLALMLLKSLLMYA